MRKHRVYFGLSDALDFERDHFRSKAAHRRRRRTKLAQKSRWLRLGAYGL